MHKLALFLIFFVGYLFASSPNVLADWAPKDLEIDLADAQTIKTIQLLDKVEGDTQQVNLKLGYVGKADSGIVVKRPDSGAVVYFPMEGLEQSDTFSYEICDEENVCKKAKVTLVIKESSRIKTIPEDLSKEDSPLKKIDSLPALKPRDSKEHHTEKNNSNEIQKRQEPQKTKEELLRYARELEKKINEHKKNMESDNLVADESQEVSHKIITNEPPQKLEETTTSSPRLSAPPSSTMPQKKNLQEDSIQVKSKTTSAEKENYTLSKKDSLEPTFLTKEELNVLLRENAARLKTLRLSRDEEDRLWEERKKLKAQLKKLP